MNNSDVRKKILPKVKTKNMTLIVVCAFALRLLPELLWGFGDTLLINCAMFFFEDMLILLFLGAGLARVVMGAWRRGEAKFSELAGGLLNGNILTTLVLSAINAAIDMCAFVLLKLAFSGGALMIPYSVMTVITLLIGVIGGYMFFVPALGEGSMKPLIAAIPRLISYEISLFWWAYLVMGAVIAVCALVNQTGAALSMILMLVRFMLCWLIGPYGALAHAGIVREIYKTP